METPRISLKTKLVLSFLVVAVIAGLVATVVGVRAISEGVRREVKEKVREDLNAAREIYNRKLKEIEDALTFTAFREFAVRTALSSGDRETLFRAIELTRRKVGIDVLTVTDEKGTVVLRARNPEVFGDNQADDEIVGFALREKRAVSSTQIVPFEELFKEGRDLAERASIEYIPTPKAKSTTQVKETSGMMLKAAVPVFGDDGELTGILYGGSLLNRNYEIVDKVKSTVYKTLKYKGKDIGTATIFQGDLRVSTNVENRDGTRAIGTRVSEEVYDRVLGEKRDWEGRAFVVHSWYETKYEPIRNIMGDVIGILYVGILEDKYIDMRERSLLIFLGITVLGVILALGVSVVLATTITRPIRLLHRGVEEIASGNFDFKVDVTSKDEIGILSHSFNQVRLHLKELYLKLQGKIASVDEDLRRVNRELIEKQTQLIQSEKLASIGRLTAGVAHEINNPLSGILTYLKLVSRIIQKDDISAKKMEEIRGYMTVMESETARCGKIVTNLLTFARQSKPDIQDSDVNQIVERSLALLKNKLRLQNIKVRKTLYPNLPLIPCDPGQIQQVVLNIVINASEAMSDGGELIIDTSLAEEGDSVLISIQDTGVGIPKDMLSKLFDPFFTTKEESKGIGLGLSVVYGIVNEHGGKVDVKSTVGEGTTFTIRLPAVLSVSRKNT
jgi:two-component system NtrC family sensor kinase